MTRISRVTAPSGADNVNSPLSLVVTAIDVPTTATVAPTTGSPVTELVTRPEMVRTNDGWGGRAYAAAAPRKSATRTSQERLTTIPPYRCTGVAVATDGDGTAMLRAVLRVRKER